MKVWCLTLSLIQRRKATTNKRQAIAGIFWILDNGAKWKGLPKEFGCKSSVHLARADLCALGDRRLLPEFRVVAFVRALILASL